MEESRAHCAFLVSRWHEAADKTSLAPTAFRPQHVSQVNHPLCEATTQSHNNPEIATSATYQHISTLSPGALAARIFKSLISKLGVNSFGFKA